MIDEILQILNTVGQVVDTPWAAVRTGIRDRSFESGLNSILDVDSRATGRQMLESLGMGENQPGLDWGDVAGFATEVIPDMILPGAGAYKAIKWLRGAGAVADVAPAGRGFLDAIDKAVPTPVGAHALPEDQLMRLISSNPIIEAAEEMPLGLPAPVADAAPYYSRLRQAIEALPGENYKSQSVLNQLKRVAPEGFAQQEVEWSKLGELLGQGPMVSKQQLLGHMDEALPTYQPGVMRFGKGETKYDQYSTGTGDYAETLLQHPGEKQYGMPTHWDDPNVLMHLRTELVDQGGKKSLLANELQSDWHQAGKTRGYGDPPLARQAELDAAAEAASSAASTQYYSIAPELRRFDNLGFDDAWQAMSELRHDDNWMRTWDVSDMPPELVSRIEAWRGLARDAQRLTNEANRLGASYPVPDAPFKEDWPLLGLKELLRQGVDQGADEVAWLPGKAVQSMVGGKLAGQEQFYDEDLLNIANKYIKNRGWDTSVGTGQTSIIEPGVDTADRMSPTFNIPITPQMRSDIRSRGQPLMSLAPLLALLGLTQTEA